jgi:hypothetical protein
MFAVYLRLMIINDQVDFLYRREEEKKLREEKTKPKL